MLDEFLAKFFVSIQFTFSALNLTVDKHKKNDNWRQNSGRKN
jgi:hypothetical protein